MEFNPINILKHTPIWVWALFAFLLYRGIIALRSRLMTLPRLLLLPAIFFVWALLSIWHELGLKWMGFAGFVVGLVLGGIAGSFVLHGNGTYHSSTGLFERRGSAWTLVLILFAFIGKFTFSVMMAYNRFLATYGGFCLLFGGFSGFVDGVFWGGTVLLLQQRYGRRKVT